MADNYSQQELKQQRSDLKGTENKAGRQEKIRQAQLKAMQRTQKMSGEAGEKMGGAAADVGTQATVAAGRGVFEAGEKGLNVATGGAYTPVDVATSVGGSAFQKGAGKAAKYGVGRPLGKQAGKAPYRPAIAMQKRRTKSAQKKGAEAKAARQQIDAEMNQDKSLDQRALRLLSKTTTKIAITAGTLPFQIALGIIMAFLMPIILISFLLFLIPILISSSLF